MDILVIEDDQPIADFIAEALHDEGYQPHIAYNAPAAIAAIKDSVPQLILLDLHIPTAKESTAFLEYWHSLANYAVPIIVITAASRVPSAELLGVTGFLVKPFDLFDLLNCVQQHVGTPPDPRSSSLQI
jgi:DNA-binding response OmpR family regulator